MGFSRYHRNLPHWRQDGAVYFITWRLSARQAAMSPAERTVVLDALRHFHGARYQLVACVIMDNHVHALVRPDEGFSLTSIIQTWKSYTSKLLLKARGASPPFWQDEYFDRIVRDAKEFEEKLSYIHHNPFKRWPALGDYSWSWWPDKEQAP